MDIFINCNVSTGFFFYNVVNKYEGNDSGKLILNVCELSILKFWCRKRSQRKFYALPVIKFFKNS